MRADDVQHAIEAGVSAWRQATANRGTRYAHTDGVALFRLATCVAVHRPGGRAPVVNVGPLQGDQLTLTQTLALRAAPHALRVAGRVGSSPDDLLHAAQSIESSPPADVAQPEP